mmetsp:Transcript_905/g.2174  ORF Transcript_905/g.2174 Transcript_905/m.2174 type:complete len:246 (+) Transcript_905:2660-3397(+)
MGCLRGARRFFDSGQLDVSVMQRGPSLLQVGDIFAEQPKLLASSEVFAEDSLHCFLECCHFLALRVELLHSEPVCLHEGGSAARQLNELIKPSPRSEALRCVRRRSNLGPELRRGILHRGHTVLDCADARLQLPQRTVCLCRSGQQLLGNGIYVGGRTLAGARIAGHGFRSRCPAVVDRPVPSEGRRQIAKRRRGLPTRCKAPLLQTGGQRVEAVRWHCNAAAPKRGAKQHETFLRMLQKVGRHR